MFYLVSFEPNWNLQNYDRLFLPRHSLNSSWHVSLPDHVFYSPIEYYPNYVWLYRDCFYRIIKTMDSESPDRLVLLVLFPSSNSLSIFFIVNGFGGVKESSGTYSTGICKSVFIDGAFYIDVYTQVVVEKFRT